MLREKDGPIPPGCQEPRLVCWLRLAVEETESETYDPPELAGFVEEVGFLSGTGPDILRGNPDVGCCDLGRPEARNCGLTVVSANGTHWGNNFPWVFGGHVGDPRRFVGTEDVPGGNH